MSTWVGKKVKTKKNDSIGMMSLRSSLTWPPTDNSVPADDEFIIYIREDTECESHDLLECECGGSGDLQVDLQETKKNTRPCQLGEVNPKERSGSNMEQLKVWRHYTAPLDVSRT